MDDQKAKNANEVSLVRCETTSGPIAMEFHREWSPHGYDRAMDLFERGFFSDSHFFRVVPKFLVQFGISYTLDQDLKKLAHTPIPDDPQHEPEIPFVEGTISYAGSGDNSRTSQLFISYGPSKSLGTQKWETPLGKVVEGMDNARNFYSGYGDGPPFGNGPAQGKIHSGRRYIEDNFPLLDSFKTCKVERGVVSAAAAANKDEPITSPKRRVRQDEHLQHAKHHKRGVGAEGTAVPRLNGAQKLPTTTAVTTGRRSEALTTAFAAFGIVILVLLLIFGYRNNGRKGSKSS